jgi:hypothetical protein
MGRKFVLILALALGLSGCKSEGSSALTEGVGGDVVLLPHHLIVESLIEDTYKDLADESWCEVIIISPDHFHQGSAHISTPPESEFGYTIHRDYVEQTWPGIPVIGYMIQTDTTEEEVDNFVSELTSRNALFIFSVDFSHYLPGDVSYLHDLRSMDVLASRSADEARSLEVDSPIALEIMLKLLAAKNETLEIQRNTNPSRDSGIVSFENTTHVFARSRLLAPGEHPPARSVHTLMFFAHPAEWYAGKTLEDRYLYGYDEVLWDQGGVDHATVEINGGSDQMFNFDYFQ